MSKLLKILAALALASPAAAEPTLAIAASPTAEPALRAVWTAQAGKDAGPRFLAVADGALVTVTWEGDLVAFEPETGKRLWRKAAPKADAIERVQVAVDGDVVVAAWPGQAELLGYEAKTGTTRWTRKLPAAAPSLVGCDGHHAAVATHRAQGTLVAAAYEPATGRPLWQTPVGGHLVGAGAGHVFLGLDSGTGRLLSGVEAVACADGHKAMLPSHERTFAMFLAAGAGRVATWHFEMGFNPAEICVTTLDEGQARDCFKASDGEVPAYLLGGAALVGERLLFATHHMEAHNLNPEPDSWLFARALDGGQIQWRSAPLTASLDPVAAGEQLLVAFGSTGAQDVARLLDPADGSSLGRLDLKKAPTALAADGKRAYVASYDGTIYAFGLVRPGAAPAERQAVAPQAMATPEPTAQPLPWRVLTTLDAHPKKARTSGSLRDGTADRVAFADAAGTLLAVGGNDDKVRVFDLATGKRLWISKSLGKDVEA
ncbi:MAG: PQQ-binding-like beta-propeller repeat protein, partial [Myxococcales bacterium]|nr:PQQ-binding-like beta-propeller repeat protein [Myxococcales bacterium]